MTTSLYSLEKEPKYSGDEFSVGLTDVFQFVQRHIGTMASFGIGFLLCGAFFTLVFGGYIASVSLQNMSGIDVPSFRYLQSALPKLEQENQEILSVKDDNLSSEEFWRKSIKPVFLIEKAEAKDLLDASSLKLAGSNIAYLQFNTKAGSEALAERRIQDIIKKFINGAMYIELRDLIRGYELKVNVAESNLSKKIFAAEVELVHVERRIQNLTALRSQYSGASNTAWQVIDARDSSSKYLPISVQIVAAKTDANSLKESLARYRDEESLLLIYAEFIEKAKPLIESGRQNSQLPATLLEVVKQIDKITQGGAQKIAVENIRIKLSSIQTNKAFGLRQTGIVKVQSPPYLKNMAISLLLGLLFGLIYFVTACWRPGNTKQIG